MSDYLIKELRRLLEPEGMERGSVLDAERECVQLVPGTFTTDVMEFEVALKEAATAREENQRRECLLRAVNLHQGELLVRWGEGEAWITEERIRLTNLALDALRELMEAYRAEGNLALALDFARRLVSADPFCEANHVALMELYVEAGEPSLALKQYETLRELLEKEFKSEPDKATCAFADSLRQKLDRGEISPPKTPRRRWFASFRSTLPPKTPPFSANERPQNFVRYALPVSMALILMILLVIVIRQNQGPLSRGGTASGVAQAQTPPAVWRTPRVPPMPLNTLRMVYVATSDLSRKADLFIANADASEEKQLTSDGTFHSPALSPDGKRIVCVRSGKYQQEQLWLMNSDGSGLKQLTSGAKDMEPAWASDSKTIAFSSSRDTGFKQVCTMNVDNPTKITRLTRGEKYNECMPCWSRNGSYLYYCSEREHRYEIYRMDAADGGNAKRLTVTDQPIINDHPHISPDDRWLVFVSNRQGGSGLWVMDTDGNRVERLADFKVQEPTHPRWSPDGSRIIFSGGVQSQVYSICVDGTDLQQLTTQKMYASEPACRAVYLPPSKPPVTTSSR